jgi:hypothetical protein
MKRILPLIPVLASLVLPGAASARIIELGSVADEAASSCPDEPCLAAVRITGLQGRSAGGPKNPYYIRRDGYIVAFTLRLAELTAEQVDYFNDNFGSPAQVRLSVLRRGDTRRTRLNYRLVAQTDTFDVDRYIGSNPTFVLPQPLRVNETNWIAISVPTWAPILVTELSRSDWWRASRPRNRCASLSQFSLSELRSVNLFGCTYSGGRLLYTATYVPDPKPTDESEAQ